MLNFTIISIKGKNVFLGINDDGNKVWTKNKNQAIWFDLPSEAKRFADNWFKTFSDWELTSLDFNVDTMQIV